MNARPNTVVNLREDREDGLLEHALSAALLDEIAETHLACDGIHNARGPIDRQIAREFAKEQCRRLDRKLTAVETALYKVIQRTMREYDAILKAEDAR